MVRKNLVLLLFVFLLLESLVNLAASEPSYFAGLAAERARRADDLFRRNCARCHGADGTGDTPLGKLFKAPDFTDHDWWRKHPNAKRLGLTVAHGKGDMPAFNKKLTKSEINLLVTYVRRFRNQPPPVSSQ